LEKIEFNSIEEAIRDIREGKLVIVLDDLKRENEGDLIGAASNANPDMINFMLNEARGAFIAVFLEEERAGLLRLPVQEKGENSEINKTQMLVSVDSVKSGSGSSAIDRALTVRILANINTVSGDLRRPGHIIPIKSDKGGILKRQGHTEAGVELMKLAGIYPPVAVDLEILNGDGCMASEKELHQIADEFGLSIITIKQIKDYIEYKNQPLKNEIRKVIQDAFYMSSDALFKDGELIEECVDMVLAWHNHRK